MNLAILIYVIGSVFEAVEPHGIVYHQVTRIQYLGVVFISPMVLLFIMDFCELKINLLRHVVPILVFPASVALLMYVNPAFMIPVIEGADSIFRYIYFVYTYAVMLLAVFLAAFTYAKRDDIFRRQIIFIIFAILVPMLGNILTVFTDVFAVDITVLCASVSGVLMGYSLLFGGLFQIAPIAREEIVEKMRDGFILVDISGNYIDANTAAKNLFPPLRTASIGRPLNKVEGIPWSEDGWDEQTLSLETETGERHYRTSMDVVRHEGVVICQCITVYDITPVQELLNETIKLAEYDSLTGLMNRRAFLQKAKEKCMEIDRIGGEALVLMLDLDLFKQVNDTYGHSAGDEVLRAVSRTMVSRFRKTDLVARYGGEEFCAFLPATNEPSELKIAEECRKAIEQMEIEFEGQTLRLTTSIGIAKYEAGCNESIETVITYADHALYEAKASGRNRCVIYDKNAENLPEMHPVGHTGNSHTTGGD